MNADTADMDMATDAETSAADRRAALRSAKGESNRSRNLSSPDEVLNQKIVRMLEDDGRRPFAEIAAHLNVSEGTIRNRVNAMRQSGHIRIVAMVDAGAMEYTTAAIIGLKISSSSTPAHVAARLGRLEEVVYILWVSGRYDLLVEVVEKDGYDGLTKFLENHIHARPDIKVAETMTGLQNFKNQFLLKGNWR